MSGGYLTDVSYVRGFQPELVPGELRAVAALNGFTPPPSTRFSYCELGCGFGDTLIALAAANPGSSFVGIDLAADHIAVARETARMGGVTNVTFLEQDFSSAAGGPFDYVAAHGVFSWVGPEVRMALVDFATRCLRPGGLLYISYNAMPAWAAVVPLRRLLNAAGGTTSLERAERGVALARKLAASHFFGDNPFARKALEMIERSGLSYVAHEFLNDYWTPLYFADVARLMHESGLPYVGSLPLFSNYRELVLPAGSGIETPDRIEYESLKDYALNTSFRRDVFAFRPAARSPAHTQEWLSTTTFALRERDDGKREAVLGRNEIALELTDCDQALARLGEGSASGLDPHVALRLLVAKKIVEVGAPTRSFDPAGTSRYTIPLAYNRAVLERPYSTQLPTLLAAPATGGAIRIDPAEAVAIRLLGEVAPDDRDAYLAAQFGKPGIEMKIDDRVLDAPEERIGAIREAVEAAEKKLVATFVELGILAPA